MFKKIILFALFLTITLATTASAGWWIFGQSQQEVASRYLYLNDMSYDELDDSVTLYRELLPQGHIVLKGKAQQGRNAIGSVQISLDDQQSWQKANVLTDGSFEFSFTPQTERTYVLFVKIIDTAGKKNEVADTRKEVTVSNQNIHALIKAALDEMISAYRDEDIRTFMDRVDEDFAGDDIVLDRAVRNDFTAFNNLSLSYTLNNVTPSSQGKVFVSISFSRHVTSTRSGMTFADFGTTEFIFDIMANSALVSAMKHPLIFGLSDASEVATGTVNSSRNQNILIVNPDGSLKLGNVREAEGDDTTTPIIGGAVPTPTNLSSFDFTPHHQCSFSFDTPLDYYGSTYVNDNYEIILEEALSPSGPWTEVERDNLIDPKFPFITTTNIASYVGFLYYRVKIEFLSDNTVSAPSNVISIDNN